MVFKASFLTLDVSESCQRNVTCREVCYTGLWQSEKYAPCCCAFSYTLFDTSLVDLIQQSSSIPNLKSHTVVSYTSVNSCYSCSCTDATTHFSSTTCAERFACWRPVQTYILTRDKWYDVTLFTYIHLSACVVMVKSIFSHSLLFILYFSTVCEFTLHLSSRALDNTDY